MVFTLIPVLINFPEDIDSISFLKRQLSVTDSFKDVYSFTFELFYLHSFCSLYSSVLKQNVADKHLKKKKVIAVVHLPVDYTL